MPIGFIVIFMSQGHNIQAGADVDRILCLTHIIGSIVHMKDFMWVHAVGNDRDAVTFYIGESVLVTIVWDVLVVGQKVIL